MILQKKRLRSAIGTASKFQGLTQSLDDGSCGGGLYGTQDFNQSERDRRGFGKRCADDAARCEVTDKRSLMARQFKTEYEVESECSGRVAVPCVKF